MTGRPFPPQRRHTLFFLDQIRDFSPVFLDTEVDATAITAGREQARRAGQRRSVVSYVVHAAAGVLAKHPEANAAIHGGLDPVVASYDTVAAKVTLDKTWEGRRVVLATVIPGLESASLADVQACLDRAAAADPGTAEEFAGIRALRRLPWRRRSTGSARRPGRSIAGPRSPARSASPRSATRRSTASTRSAEPRSPSAWDGSPTARWPGTGPW